MASPFERIGGHPCLDFVNTLGGASKARDVERLVRYEDAVRWAQEGGTVDAVEADRLRSLAAAGGGPEALAELRRLRETLYQVFSSAIDERHLSAGLQDELTGRVKAALADARLAPTDGAFRWQIDGARAGLGLIAQRLGIATLNLLGSGHLSAVRSCQLCSWLFLDPSPTKRRRWCSMAVCGNRAKARRHYRRLITPA